MEKRVLLSATNPFYDLTAVASTANGSFASFGDLPSINNSGDIAFVGNAKTGNGLWIARSNGTLTNITPTFTSKNDSRTYGRLASINDNDQVVARDQFGIQYFVREWTGTNPDQHADVITTPTPVPSSADDNIDSAQTFTAINDNGDVAFVAYDHTQAARYVDEASGNDVLDGTYATLLTTDASGAQVSPRPQLTNDGRALYVTPDGNLYLATSATQREFIAGARSGFTSIDPGAGVSKDGRIVVFSGDRGNGPGIFASYQSGGGRTLVRIAGEGLDGFTKFDDSSNVVVNSTDVDGTALNGNASSKSQRGATIAFEGTSSLGTGIYSARLSLFGDSAVDFDPNDPAQVTVSGIVPVALNNSQLTPGFSDVRLGDGINDVGRGEIAFWAKTSNGNQEIVRAEPQQVVWINFEPPNTLPSGATGENLALFKNLGITGSGWSASFEAALQNVGMNGLSSGFETDIVNAVHKAFSDAHASVRVLGALGDIAPSYVPYVITNKQGQPIGIDGKPVQQGQRPLTSGAYQTIYVGGAPATADAKVLGYSSPVYGIAGGLDFYNQISDDTAVIFADSIFKSSAFPTGTNLDALPYATKVNAVADTIAHEAGHNFGLFHLDPTLSSQMMHGGTNANEFNSAQVFGASEQPVQRYDASLSGVTESSANRLHFATNGNTAEPPDPHLLTVDDKSIHAKLSLNLTAPSFNVADLMIGVTTLGQADLLPVYQDLGGGDLATLLGNIDLPVTPGATVSILGSTTGTSLDVVGVALGNEGAQSSLSNSVLGLASDSRLASPVNGGSGGFHFYQFTSGAWADLGTVSIASSPVNHSPVLSPIANQAATIGSTVTFTASATDPDAGQTLTYSLGAGAPTDASIDPNTGAFTWTPAANQTGRVYDIKVIASDNGTPPLSATESVTINVVNRLKVTAITELTTPIPGPLQVAIDFNEALQSPLAQAIGNYQIISHGGVKLPIQSAVYTDSGTQHRVVLTIAAGTTVVPDVYDVSVNGVALTAANGDQGPTNNDQLWVDVTSENTFKQIIMQPDGSFGLSGSQVFLGNGSPQEEVAGNFTGNGRNDLIVVTNAGSQVNPINSLVLLKNNGDGVYALPVPITIPGLPAGSLLQIQTINSVDWNHDGSPDLVLGVGINITSTSPQVLKYLVLLNDGHGNFTNAPQTPIPVTNVFSLQPTVVYDLKDDGSFEIIHPVPPASFNGDATLEVIGKDPIVGYTPQIEIDTGSASLPQYTFADVNGDGKPDIILGNGASVMLSTPTGYTSPQSIPSGAIGGITAMAVGAFTGPGHKDLALLYDNYSNSLNVHDGSEIQVIENNGTGNFTALTPIILNRRFVSGVFGDVNGDGVPDLVMGLAPSTGQYGTNPYVYDHVSQPSVWTWAADGHASFSPTTTAPVAIPPADQGAATLYVGGTDFPPMTLTDVDGDGYPDVLLNSSTSSSLGIDLNDGTGTMRAPTHGLAFVGQAASQYDVNPQLRGISQKVFADLTNNGREDFVAITPSGLDVFLAQSDGSFRYAANIPNPFDSTQITWLRIGDLNNDGIPDIVCGDGPYGGDMAVLLGNGDGGFRLAQTFIAETTSYRVFNATLADVNGDGKLDLIAFLGNSGFGVFFGDGKGNLTFNANTLVPAVNNAVFPGQSAASAISPVLGNFNGDNILDMVVPTANGLQDYLGNGNGTFNPGPMIDNTDYVQIMTCDFAGSGILDLVVFSSDLRATVYLGDGHGGFTKGSSLDLSVGSDSRGNTILPAELALGDFNGDGKLDLAVDYYDADSAASPPGFVDIYPGDGTGNFGTPQKVTVGQNPFTLVSIPHTPFFDAGTFNVTDHGPVANNVTATVVDGTSVAIAALAADSDPDKAPLHMVGLTTPAHGVAHLDASGNIIYAPAAGFTGADSFSYTIADPAGAQATAGVTVTTTPSAVLAFSAATYKANETDATATITLVRTGGSVGAASVTLTTSDGTAMSDADYTATKQTVTWADGDTANKTVPIPLLNDAGTGEGAQTVNLKLSGQTGGATIGSQSTATLTISEDDVGSTQSGSLAFSAATYNANETDGMANITLVRTGGSTGAISVTVSTSNGSAGAGADYNATNQTVSWADGDTANKTISIPLLDDNAAGENAQTVDLSLSAPTGGAAIGSQSTATLIIDEDNDSGGSGPPSPTANPDTFVLGPAGPFSGSGSTNVLANDVSNDGQPQNLMATVIVPPVAGSLAMNPNGSFTYAPSGTFQGIDRFTYQASEGTTAGNTATVTLLSYHAGLVDKLYHQVLHRSAEDGGLIYWTAQLDAGKPLDVVATGIFNSTERLNPLVTQFYQQFLGRGTDPSGLAYWVADWQKKGDPRDVVENILASQEFFDDAVDTNLGYIKLLYQRVLQRPAEQSGLGYWTGLMSPPSNESRSQIASQFYDTHEKHVDLVDFLFGEYFNGVSPLPPTQPYVTDLDASQTETQVEKAIIDSPDYNANPPEPAAGSVGRSLYPH